MSEQTPDAQLKKLDVAEHAIDSALNSGIVDRHTITKKAHQEATDSLEMVGAAIESDEVADEARRITMIAEQGGDRERIKRARQREREARKQARARHREATKSAKRAYEAIKFSEPNKLGLMRVVQVAFAAHIVVTLLLLLLTSRDNYEYDLIGVVRWVLVILEGMAFWAFVNRYKIARPLVIAVAVVSLATDVVAALSNQSFTLASFVKDGIFYVLLILYFAFSDRVKSTLVNDLSTKRPYVLEDDELIARRGWPRVRNLTIYFIVFSVLGHWMEMAMCQLIRLGLVEGEYDPTNTMLWRDWLYPFPMEGAAVVIIALVLYPLFQWLKKHMPHPLLAYVLSFLTNAFACSAIEFCMGLIVNADYQLWDYRENFGNIMGQVCLQNALAFGAACSIITWFVYPMLERWIARQPRDYMNIAFVATLMFGAIIWSLYIVEPPTVPSGTVASGSYAGPGNTSASFALTTDREAAGFSEDEDGIKVTFTRSKTREEELKALQDSAASLREQLAHDETLTEQQRVDALAQLDGIEQSVTALEETLKSK